VGYQEDFLKRRNRFLSENMLEFLKFILHEFRFTETNFFEFRQCIPFSGKLPELSVNMRQKQVHHGNLRRGREAIGQEINRFGEAFFPA
jgi:hypothetical protein